MYYYTKNLKFLLAKLKNRFRISISRSLNKILGLIQNNLFTEEKKDSRFRKNGVKMQAKQKKKLISLVESQTWEYLTLNSKQTAIFFRHFQNISISLLLS